ncbi:response regulator [Psychroflexus sediminis]|uniref:Two component transcriptional regulator, LuxR family n=1 Tax=Psychroflexus sediminis TaxID=470826 RepID=A0A1G7XIM5_9FLAO|nr:response regulator transcription factor [Psychroflexus sediminis]SDG84052.1 two component transcriptional regulator, LuxR family [Psychroflexus sediminis]
MKIKLVIFEDNHQLRKSLEILLNTSESYVVIGNFPHVSKAKEIILDLRPHLVILDIDMPGKDGITAIPVIKEIDPEIFILMYTQFEDDEKIFRSLCAGADGYILKKTSPLKLILALDEVRKGGAPMSPAIARKVLASFHTSVKDKINYNLTSRETEVLKYLIKGCSVKYIASELYIAYETCRSHLKNIYTKLHVNCGKEAIAKVLAEKIEL